MGTTTKHTCYHCGDNCPDDHIHIAEKYFCCDGCKLVFEILDQNDMCNYYDLEAKPGTKIKSKPQGNKFAYLDDLGVQKQLIRYQDDEQTVVMFHIPQIHCASCLWLLENLYKLRPGIESSKVEFVKKQVTINFQQEQISLRQLVELLASIGYGPALNFGDLEGNSQKKVDRKLFYQLGVAGFAFGNIMLLSFPDYLGMDTSADWAHSQFFGLISIVLALPVFLYSSTGYFTSAWHGLRKGFLNIDVPVALGILVLFFWSCYEILSGLGSGYMDSLAGLVFFLLIGKWYQSKTYERLSFERDHRSYFPIAITKLIDGEEQAVPLTSLQPGDRILVRNQELIPADGILESENAKIDNSFVTGEAKPIIRMQGAQLYAGGRQVGGNIILTLTKQVSQSYLTQLWSHDAFKKQEQEDLTTIANRVSRYFTPIILALALGTFVFWAFKDMSWAIRSVAAVLIVACPCAFALASPFTFGNAMRILGRAKTYLKNTGTIERLAAVDTIVFDKTGTITQTRHRSIQYKGTELSEHDLSLVRSLVHNSLHPLSQELYNHIKTDTAHHVTNFIETEGKGIEGLVDHYYVRVGSERFVSDIAKVNAPSANHTRTWVAINDKVMGYFEFEGQYREGLNEIVAALKPHYKLAVLSGDNAAEEKNLKALMGDDVEMLFHRSPMDKLEYILDLQQRGHNVMMVGDGLNDAGALKQSNVGVTISEDVNNFSPACDAILDARQFGKLHHIMRFSRGSINVVRMAFGISFMYNAFGLFFAMQGLLNPVMAAILMPVSSLTVVLFSTLGTWWLGNKYGLLQDLTDEALNAIEQEQETTLAEAV